MLLYVVMDYVCNVPTFKVNRKHTPHPEEADPTNVTFLTSSCSSFPVPRYSEAITTRFLAVLIRACRGAEKPDTLVSIRSSQTARHKYLMGRNDKPWIKDTFPARHRRAKKKKGEDENVLK